jgi:hypothetical protein
MKRVWLSLLLSLVLFVPLGCASIPVSTVALDWADADESWSIQVVTVDPDGADRVTRIWMAVEAGEGVLRTNNSRWWANLTRDPKIRVRHRGADHLFSVKLVTEQSEKVRIDEVFLKKFGGWERMMFSQERGETHDNYARLLRPH